MSPKEQPGVRLVSQNLAQIFRGRQRLSSHNRTPNAVRGQGRALFSQRFRPVSFGRFTPCSQGVIE